MACPLRPATVRTRPRTIRPARRGLVTTACLCAVLAAGGCDPPPGEWPPPSAGPYNTYDAPPDIGKPPPQVHADGWQQDTPLPPGWQAAPPPAQTPTTAHHYPATYEPNHHEPGSAGAGMGAVSSHGASPGSAGDHLSGGTVPYSATDGTPPYADGPVGPDPHFDLPPKGDYTLMLIVLAAPVLLLIVIGWCWHMVRTLRYHEARSPCGPR